MKIFDREKQRRNEDIRNSLRRGAMAYGNKISTALDMLMDFDDRQVQDLDEVKRSLEATGTPCIVFTTAQGYQCLLDVNGKLLASHIIENYETDQ